MKNIRYAQIRRVLKKVYFAPERGSEERLLEKLGLPYRGDIAERRFVTGFRIALAATVALVCLMNISSVKPEYLNRYQIDSAIDMSRSIDTSPLWQHFLLKKDG